jgi:hypothetical protein
MTEMETQSNDLDRHLFFGVRQPAYLDRLTYSPGPICVLEIGRLKVRNGCLVLVYPTVPVN